MSIPFYKAIVLGENEYEFFTDSHVFVSLESAFRDCQNILGAENIYGYVIVKVTEDDWTVVHESVYGCDYTVYCDENGTIKVEKGRSQIVIIGQ